MKTKKIKNKKNRKIKKANNTNMKILIILIFVAIFITLMFKQTKEDTKSIEKINLDKTIYLTFDDGPSKWTTQMIDLLKKYNVKATFFITNPEGREEVVKYIEKEGHKIGIHSYSHDYNEIYKNSNNFWNDIEKMNEIIKKITDKKTDIIRFPGGSKNVYAVGEDGQILKKLIEETKNKKYEYFDWNVSAGDGGGVNTDIDYITNNMINGIKNNKTSIVLCHDTYENAVYAIENVIKWAFDNGYNFRVINKNEYVYHF